MHSEYDKKLYARPQKDQATCGRTGLCTTRKMQFIRAKKRRRYTGPIPLKYKEIEI
jgi:hypothetical protein